MDIKAQILTQKLETGLEGLVKLLEEADVSVDAAGDDIPALAATEQSQRPELLQACCVSL